MLEGQCVSEGIDLYTVVLVVQIPSMLGLRYLESRKKLVIVQLPDRLLRLELAYVHKLVFYPGY